MFENLSALNLLNFFNTEMDIFEFENFSKLKNKKYKLQNFSKYLNQEDIVDSYIAFNKNGLYFHFDVDHPFTKSTYPEIKTGDSIELFIDTRNLKTKGYITKFCHHFVFFIEEIQNFKAKEITKFSANDMHKICDANLLKSSVTLKKNSYSIDITLPKECLYGFDIDNFSKIGFCYRVNRYLKNSLNFNVSNSEHNIERSFHLFPSLNLKK
jgi:hypothetical protein